LRSPSKGTGLKIPITGHRRKEGFSRKKEIKGQPKKERKEITLSGNLSTARKKGKGFQTMWGKMFASFYIKEGHTRKEVPATVGPVNGHIGSGP